MHPAFFNLLMAAASGPLALGVSAPDANGWSGTANPTIAESVSASSTASAFGGTAPYTYVWAKVSGTTLTLTNGSTATATFTTTVPAGTTVSAIYKCTAKDNTNATVVVNINVNLTSGAQG